MKNRAILFDLDGTLVDSAPDLIAALNAALTRNNHASVTRAQVTHRISEGARSMVSHALGNGHMAIDHVVSDMLAHYADNLAVESSIYPGMQTVLDYLATTNTAWGIITNKMTCFAQPLTQALQLFPPANCLISGDTLDQKKPHPAPLLEAARRLGIPPHLCVYVGDAKTDMDAGRAAGMRTLIAAYGYIPDDMDTDSWQADASLAQPEALLPWFENWLSVPT